MFQWFRDLIHHFRRPINGSRGTHKSYAYEHLDLPNYGNIPNEIIENPYADRFFGDGREEENWKIIRGLQDTKKN